MTDDQAQAFIRQLEPEKHRYATEIVPTSNRGKKRSAVRVTLKAGQRVATIKQPEQWVSVKKAWEGFRYE